MSTVKREFEHGLEMLSVVCPSGSFGAVVLKQEVFSFRDLFVWLNKWGEGLSSLPGKSWNSLLCAHGDVTYEIKAGKSFQLFSLTFLTVKSPALVSYSVHIVNVFN